MSKSWLSIPAPQLGKYLLHLPEDVTKHWRLLDPHPVWTEAEAKPPGAVKRVLLVPPVPIIVEAILLLIIILILIMGHSIEEGVPDTLQKVKVKCLCMD